MKRLTVGKQGVISLDTMAAGVMCMYAVLIYCGLISDLLASVQSLCLYGIVGLALLLVIMRGRLKCHSCWLWYGGFVMYSAFSVLYASSPSTVLNSLYGLIIVLALAFSLTQILTSEKRIEMLLRCFVIGSVILMLYMVATGKLDTSLERGGRLGGNLAGNANAFASLFMFSACATVYFIWGARKILVKLLYVLAFALQVYALVLSGGRKFLLLPFVVLYFMLLLSSDKRGRKHIIGYTLVGVVGGAVLLYLLMNVPFLYENIGYRFEGFLNYASGSISNADYSTIQRELMSSRAFELWLEAPIIGHGLNMFSVLGGWGVYSHRNYLELLCNHGLIGFILYYSYWVYLAFQLYRIKENSVMKLFLLAVLGSFVIFDYGAVSYSMPQLQFFIVMMNMYLYLQKQKARNKRVCEYG